MYDTFIYLFLLLAVSTVNNPYQQREMMEDYQYHPLIMIDFRFHTLNHIDGN